HRPEYRSYHHSNRQPRTRVGHRRDLRPRLLPAFAWLTKFLIARIIFLGIDGLWIIAALSRLGTGGDSGGLLPLAQLIIDLAYGAVLIMSFVSPRPGSRS